ncbi:MAG TPA: sulfite exporter TauE/SafE family protein [Roseiarcus sp.]|nr:sulfite exporter TauE/SafE family protein [Roseiarcus sp.]
MLYTISGFLVGAIVGLTGVGGGSLMTPILVLLFGVHPATAVGTDLLYAAATKSIGAAVHGFNGAVVWRITGLLALGSAPMALLMIYLLRLFGPFGGGASTLITEILGVALLLTALAMLLKTRLQAFATARKASLSEGARAALTVATGVVLGIFVSLSSVGAGALGVTALILLYPNLQTRQIVGSDIAHAVPLALVAGLGHWLIGSVNFSTLGLLLAGSIPGIVIGSYAAPRLPEMWLRPALAGVLIVVGVRLMF